MARSGSPDDPPDGFPDGFPDDHVEPTQYANYGGTEGMAYTESANDAYHPPIEYDRDATHKGWYQRPAVLIGFGVLTAAMLALLIYAIVDFTSAEKSRSTVTTVTSTATLRPPTTESRATESPDTTPPRPSTTTMTVEPPVITTTQPPAPITTTAVRPSMTTVTETTIERRFPRLPNRLNPPTLYEPAPGQ